MTNSDMGKEDIEQLGKVWPRIPTLRKQTLMEDVKQLGTHNMLLSFIELGLLAIQDNDAKVRLDGVIILSEYEDHNLIPIFIKLLEQDTDIEVRSAATGALGKYIYFGEIEVIPKKSLDNIEERLLAIAQTDPVPAVRRQALEALGYSSHPEVKDLIEDAYTSKEKEWIASAIFAMARSANKTWTPHVMEMLENIHPIIRSEAARAAGKLEIVDAVPILIQLLDDPDENTRHNCIWSLSQIPSEEVGEILNKAFENAEDEQDIDLISDALYNLEFNQELPLMLLLDLPEDDQDYPEEIDQSFLEDEDSLY